MTRAAERLGLTQQGMSGQLSRMRNLFDDPLFVRAKGGVVPRPGRRSWSRPSVLHSLRLFDERYVGVARAGHPLLAGGAVSVDAFCDHPHLLVSPCRGDAAGPTDEALAAIGRSRRIGLVVPGFSVVGALLEQTDLIAVLPERMIGAMRRDLETFEPPVRVAGFRLNAYWPPRLDVSPPHRWLRNEIARAAKTCNVFRRTGLRFLPRHEAPTNDNGLKEGGPIRLQRRWSSAEKLRIVHQDRGPRGFGLAGGTSPRGDVGRRL